MRKIILKSKIEQSFDTIREEFARVEEERDKALGKVAAWNKDTEIQKLTGQIGRLREEMSRGVNPSAEQWAAAGKWEEAHVRKFHQGSSGATKAGKYEAESACFSYSFSYTQLGRLGTVECETCRRIAVEKSGGDYLEYLRLLTDRDYSCSIGEV